MLQVMVVEDEFYARKSILKILNECDLDVRVVGEACNGKEAIMVLNKLHYVDLIITDIKMDEMDGLELSKYASENMKETDILILTAYASFQYAQEAIRYRVFEYLVKPITKRDLIPAIERVIESRKGKILQDVMEESNSPLDNGHGLTGKRPPDSDVLKTGMIVDEILKEVDKNYKQDISLRELAEKRYFVNYSYLSRIFSQKVGISFSKYLIQVRLKKATEYLQDTNENVRLISYEVGYKDVSHFIQSFKKEYGVTPAEYRIYGMGDKLKDE